MVKIEQAAGLCLASDEDAPLLLGIGETEEEAIADLEAVKEAKRLGQRRPWRKLADLVKEPK